MSNEMLSESRRGRHFFEPSNSDYDRAKRLQVKWEAASLAEVVRRALITVEALQNVQDNGGEIVLCKQGEPDKVIWKL